MKHIHFVGIGGAGMAPLAGIMLQRGVRVSGSDREANGKTAKLAEQGAKISIGHAAENVPPGTELVVYSSAVPAENPERQLGIPELRRGKFLAELAKQYKRPVAISGSHGKSSITALLIHLLKSGGCEPGFLIGAEVHGAPSASAGEGDDLFVMEVDESDGTHTLIHSHLGIIPNVEDDHSWSVGGSEQLFRNFRMFAEQSERVLYYPGPKADRLFSDLPAAERLEFPEAGQYGAAFPGFLGWNLHLAFRAAQLLGVKTCSPEGFGGVARRMTLRFYSDKLTVIEDYAHHPTELARSIEALRANYPNHHLRLVFQPHRYARLQKYLPELAAELRKADSVIVTPVFAAWSEKGPCGGAELAAASNAEYIDAPWSQIAQAALDYNGSAPLLIAVIGAGDIDRIFPHLPF